MPHFLLRMGRFCIMRVCAGRTLQAFSVKLQAESGNMIGTIVNVIAIVAGSVIGGTLKRVMSERVSSTLFTAMGVAAMVLGINSAVQNMSNSSYPVLFIASLAIGGAIGSSLRLGERMGNATSRRGGKELGQGLVTGCLLFCVGTLSILGPPCRAHCTETLRSCSPTPCSTS